MTSPGHPGSADAVVVGGGTIGGWCAYFLRRAGLDRVVLLEKGLLGQGASSRIAFGSASSSTPWSWVTG